MRRPQQEHVDGADNLPAGELDWEPLGDGRHRVRYCRPDGVTLRPFVGSPEEAEKFFFKHLADLRARAKGHKPPSPDLEPITSPPALEEAQEEVKCFDFLESS